MDKVEAQSVLTDWDGPTDPENPQNWSTALKWFHTLLIATFGFTATLATSIITPGLHQIAHDFETSTEVATVAFAIYVLGLSIGAPVASPLSEAFGRKHTYQIGLLVSSLFILGTGFASNVAALIITRFLAGIFASPALSCGASSVSDVWSPEQRSTPLALFVLTPFLGPALGPMIGAFVTTTYSWRWTSWTVLFFYAASIGPSIFQRETYKQEILRRRARQRAMQGPSGIKRGDSMSSTVLLFIRTTLGRPLHMLFTEPVVWSFCLYVAFNFALQYSFFTAFPYVFERYYGFDLNLVGLTFLALGIGSALGVAGNFLIDLYIYKPKVARASQVADRNATSRAPPEHRLYSAMLGGPLITISFFLFGWTTIYSIHWVVPLIGEVMFGAGTLLVFVSCSAYLVDTFGPLYGASAIAANSMLRYFLGFVFPLFALQMFEGMGVQWACTMLGCLSVLAMLIPYVLFIHGPTMRAKTKYAR